METGPYREEDWRARAERAERRSAELGLELLKLAAHAKKSKPKSTPLERVSFWLSMFVLFVLAAVPHGAHSSNYLKAAVDCSLLFCAMWVVLVHEKP
jgi:hypothetical protein